MQAAETVARDLLRRWANRGEASLALIRGAFLVLVLARLVALGEYRSAGPGRALALFDAALLPLALAAAVVVFLGARKDRFGARFLVGSSVVDAFVCFLSLFSNVLWPVPEYSGITTMPDAAVTVALVSLSALRLTPAASVASVASNAASLVGLALLDAALNPGLQRGTGLDLGMLLIYVAVSGAAAVAASMGARSLVLRTASEVSKSERAHQSFSALLREHHDVRTLISAARLQLDLELRDRPSARVQAIGTALEQLADFVEAVKSRSFSEMASLEGTASADVSIAAAAAAQAAGARFPQVRFVLPDAAPCAVQVAGGERALCHVLFNLFVNACEGNGTSGAREVRLKVEPSGADLRVELTDDGPGFAAAQLGVLTHLLSTKRDGTGHGLALAAEVVQSSGGEVSLANGATGGGCVRLRLPRRAQGT